MNSRFCNQIQDLSDNDYIITGSPTNFSLKGTNLFSPNFDIYPCTDIDSIFKNSFKRLNYPTNFNQTNPFCPLCGSFVTQNVPSLIYDCTNFRKKYLAHEDCLKKEDINCLNALIGDINEAKITPINLTNHTRNLSLGGKQYYVELQMAHSVSGFVFFKLSNKLKSIGSQLNWDMKNINSQECFSPNIIALPIPDFELSVSLTEMGQKNKKIQVKTFVNISKLKITDNIAVKASSDELEIILNIISNEDDKKRTIDDMNFKYRYPIDINLPLVEFYRLKIKISSEQSDEEDSQSIENSSITELLNEKSSQTSTIKSMSFYKKDDKTNFYSQITVDKSYDKEKVDLQKLIINNKLGQYVRNNTQSRNFQNFLNEASQFEVDQIIKNLYQELPDLITHEYANYMVQKLFGLCTMTQRLRIIDRLIKSIPFIAKNKQGTHTLQTLIALFTNQEQYRMIKNSIAQTFLQLSKHPNSTHFIQKIIKIFPLVHTIDFFHFGNANFLSFAIDKNAMCVIKSMFNRIKELMEHNNNSKTLGMLEQIRKLFIRSAIFALNQIIQDAYGNYVIQFCYEMFGEDRCTGITETIIDRFLQYSIQKYSCSVVEKCITMYWTSKEAIDFLKSSLRTDTIHEMYYNKQGNKILLAMMEKFEGTALREKIHNQLMMVQPTKFNPDRWGVVMGSRSGTVGCFANFSDAVRKAQKKKGKNYNNIH